MSDERKPQNYEVLATAKFHGVDSPETCTVRGTDPDDACGKAVAVLRDRVGETAEIHVRRIVRTSGTVA